MFSECYISENDWVSNTVPQDVFRIKSFASPFFRKLTFEKPFRTSPLRMAHVHGVFAHKSCDKVFEFSCEFMPMKIYANGNFSRTCHKIPKIYLFYITLSDASFCYSMLFDKAMFGFITLSDASFCYSLLFDKAMFGFRQNAY